jgi:hypothetical protein
VRQPSFEKFNYSLRPAKNVERKMLCEAMSRLSRIAPLPYYQYVGFGSIGFVDFSLFHQRLGVRDMVSIEADDRAKSRAKFNRPYSCIQMKWGYSHEILPKLKWTKRSIIWLDYDVPINPNVLSDVATVASSVKSGSMLVITIDAVPKEIDTEKNTAEERLKDLRLRVGKDLVPSSITGTDLAGWGTAKTTRAIIDNYLKKVLSDRNAPLKVDSRIAYEQLFNFHYADGAKMVTVGGVFLNPSDQEKISAKHFDDLEFTKTGDEPYLIEAPILTLREIRYLDERLPRTAPEVPHPKWLPEVERKKYGKVYRYFPAFSEVET